MELKNDFAVPGSPEEMWKVLLDVPRVIPCMPGATLRETLAEDRWKADMAVKLGPVKLSFDTDVRREHVDEEAHSVVLTARAREQRGRGGATARIHTSLSGADGGTRVDIATDLSLSGTVARYGRGLVQDVSQELVELFAQSLKAELASSMADGAAPGEGPAAPTAGPSGSSSEPRALSLMLRALWRSAVRWIRGRR